MSMRRHPARQRGQWSLIGLLAAIAIIMILAATIVPNIAARHSQPGQPATPRERAYGSACSEYASQMNQAVQMYKVDHDDHAPASLEELKKYGVTDDLIYAPGCSYQIDPDSGVVTDTGGGKAVNSRPPAPGPQLPRGFHPDALPASPRSPAPNSPQAPSAAPSQNGAPGGMLPGGVRMPNIPTTGADM